MLTRCSSPLWSIGQRGRSGTITCKSHTTPFSERLLCSRCRYMVLDHVKLSADYCIIPCSSDILWCGIIAVYGLRSRSSRLTSAMSKPVVAVTACQILSLLSDLACFPAVVPNAGYSATYPFPRAGCSITRTVYF